MTGAKRCVICRRPLTGPIPHTVCKEAMARAADTLIDRDRWQRQAESLQRQLDGHTVGPGDHDLTMWRIWRERSDKFERRADGLGTAVALADRAIRAVAADPAMAKSDTIRALKDYRTALAAATADPEPQEPAP